MPPPPYPTVRWRDRCTTAAGGFVSRKRRSDHPARRARRRGDRGVLARLHNDTGGRGYQLNFTTTPAPFSLDVHSDVLEVFFERGVRAGTP